MAKDLITIYRAIDERELKRERDRISAMQDAGLYPKSFDFPITMQFELTSNCNVYCKHCYNKSGGAKREDAMTPERWIEFAKYLVAHGGLFECVISGGEPLLLGDELFEIMDILHDDGTCFLLITNGLLLDSAKVERLRKYRYHWLQVSIDGSDPSYHDSFRQREGSWQHAVDGAFSVSAVGIPLTIAHSVTPGNLDKIDEMCELAYSLGASSIIVGDVDLSGRSADNKEIILDIEQRRTMLESIERNTARFSGKMLIQRSAETRISVRHYLNSPTSGGIVRPNGDLRLDCMVPFTIGNIIEGDFLRIWQAKHETCWKDPRVLEYIDRFQSDDVNTMMTNYVDEDIKL